MKLFTSAVSVMLAVLTLAAAAPVGAAPTTFRMSELYLRDPHTFVRILFLCLDVTDAGVSGMPSFNESLNDRITTDADGDGYLDLNALIIFDPLNQAGHGGQLVLHSGLCTAPMAGTTCTPDTTSPIERVNYTNGFAGTCLAPQAGTTGGYSPGITRPSPPCFVTDPLTVLLDMDGVVILLEGGQVAARYVGNPATGLVEGLLAGFLSEAAADTIIIPPEYPLIGGLPLSSILPGGTGCCAGRDDRDLGPDGVTLGWWFYLNFVAEEVPFEVMTGVPVAAATGPALRLYPGVPNPFGQATTLSYSLPAAGPVRIRVHDARGRLVAKLAEGLEEAGRHEVVWNGRDVAGNALAPGIYFARLEAGGEAMTQKLLLH